NPLIQFVMQPILIFAVVFHFVMGFVLEIKNRNSREVKYAMSKGEANSSWVSRNMIYSGATILAFIGLHFYDFWIPEIVHKYIQFAPEDPSRYFSEMTHKFESPVRVVLYAISFVFLSLHLLHGFQSAFQSIGARHRKYTPQIAQIGKIYGITIPVGFIFIAIFHYINTL
ncbi:MAG: succinate dehydrogenase / fumarate reductase cytochrome b subunit, partial [Cyclobacteriaceae bacterium]